MVERQRWFGENVCDICGEEIKGILDDTRRRDVPEWATMCRKCYRTYGSDIGWGSGQKYEEENGEFYLTAGGEPEENDSNKENPDMDVNDILRMFFKS
jgi:ribosome-binding protein aMBF1 (putative translation factor)